MMSLNKISENKAFGGRQLRYVHHSRVLNCDMKFSVYLPPHAKPNVKVPVLLWLSGLTCTDENFTQKAGAQRIAAELGIAIVAPDTSPRGDDVPNVADDYALGQGAGFYLNATQEPWNKHFHMYDYIVKELPELVKANLPVTDKWAISGHSMGGMGALSIAFKNPEMFTSVSAFSPVCHPIQCPWGVKAFTTYLGSDSSAWKQYDPVCLLNDAGNTLSDLPILIDQGSEDEFIDEQLMSNALIDAADEKGVPVEFRFQEGYDHSYFFIASFIEGHLRFHAKNLLA